MGNESAAIYVLGVPRADRQMSEEEENWDAIGAPESRPLL
jgi:hypothetical protein